MRRRRTDAPVTSSPSMTTAPASGSTNPRMQARSVVLPEPERPDTAAISPAASSNERPSSTRRPSYVFVSPVMDTAAIGSFPFSRDEGADGEEREERERDHHGGGREREQRVLLGKAVGVRRQDLGAVGDDAGEDERAAEFPHGARPGQREAGGDLATGHRHEDAQEHVLRVGAQRPRHEIELRLADVAEPLERMAEREGARDDELRDDDRREGEGDVPRPPRPERVKVDDADRDRREGLRDVDHQRLEDAGVPEPAE